MNHKCFVCSGSLEGSLVSFDPINSLSVLCIDCSQLTMRAIYNDFPLGFMNKVNEYKKVMDVAHIKGLMDSGKKLSKDD